MDPLKMYFQKLWSCWNAGIPIKLVSRIQAEKSLEDGIKIFSYYRLVCGCYPQHIYSFTEKQKILLIREMRRHLRFMGITAPKIPKAVSAINAKY
jgi:hypothetical protein